MDEFHDDVFIPYTDGTERPTPPQRAPGDDGPRFTREEKVFFIHFLRWKLRQKPSTSKKRLFKALAREVRLGILAFGLGVRN